MRLLPIRTGRTVVATAVLFASMAIASTAADDFRTWNDGSGKFAIKAKLVSAEGGTVVLEREDGTEIEIERKKLSPADQKFLDDRDKEEADNPFKTSKKAKDPFKPKAKGRSGEEKTITPNWAKVRTVIAAPAGGEWTVAVDPAPVASPKLRPVGLPNKSNFFEGMKGLVVSADGRKAAVGYAWDQPKPMGTTRVVLCDLEAGTQLEAASTSGLMAPLALSDDGSKILMRRDEFGFGNADRLEVWSLSDSGVKKELTFVPHPTVNGGDHDVKWAAYVDDKRVLTRSEGGKITLWEIDQAKPVYSLDAKGGGVRAQPRPQAPGVHDRQGGRHPGRAEGQRRGDPRGPQHPVLGAGVQPLGQDAGAGEHG